MSELWYKNFTVSDEREILLRIKKTGIPIEFCKNDSSEILLGYRSNDSISQFKIKKGIINFSFLKKDASDKIFINVFKDFNSAFNEWISQLRFDFNNTFFERNSAISKKSEKFYPVFEEAIIINRLGFEDSSGMIFRKALEMLFKDYLHHILPIFENEIKKMTVGRLVYHFYTNELEVKNKFNDYKENLELVKPLINFINQTFKIGNDFSHYDRKLENLTAKTMEENIYKILKHIIEEENIIELQNRKILRDNDMIKYNVSE